MQPRQAEQSERPDYGRDGTGLTTTPPIRVNEETCDRLAALLVSCHVPRDEEDSRLPGFSREEAGNFYLLLVAICHQTSPRGRPPLEGTVNGQRKRGWDYLSAKLEAAAAADRSWLDPGRWAPVTAGDLTELFRDPVLGDRLSEPGHRAFLIRDLGEGMRQRGWRWFEELYRLCRGWAATGEPNLFGLLGEFVAYRDPVRKKSSFLLALMRNSGLWTYRDGHRVGPPVDYHEVRGHLRIGTVAVTDPALRRKLMEGLPVTAAEDVALRGAVYDAIMRLSELTGLWDPSRLHYLFWNVFRTHCVRENPLCFVDAPALPKRYRPLELVDGARRCPFSGVCASASSSPTQRYYEHVFETDYY